MKLLNLRGRIARESDGAPVRDGGRFIVDRLGDDEVGSALVRVEEARMSASRDVNHRLWHPQNTQDRVVEPPRSLDVIGAYHRVEQQFLSPYRYEAACGGGAGSEQAASCALSRLRKLFTVAYGRPVREAPDFGYWRDLPLRTLSQNDRLVLDAALGVHR